MHLDSSGFGVEFRKTEVGPGEEVGDEAGVPCAVQQMKDGRSQGILVAGIPCLHLLPEMVTVMMKNRVCLFSPAWRGEERSRSCLDLSVHFLSLSPGEKQVEHTGASFPKPLLGITAWDDALSTAEFTVFLIQ